MSYLNDHYVFVGAITVIAPTDLAEIGDIR